MKNTQSQEQIASGEQVRSSLYKLENTWLKRKTQEMSCGFLEMPVNNTSGNNITSHDQLPQAKKQKSSGKVVPLLKVKSSEAIRTTTHPQMNKIDKSNTSIAGKFSNNIKKA